VKSLGAKLLEHKSSVVSLQREGVNLSANTDCFVDQLDNRYDRDSVADRNNRRKKGESSK